MSGIKGWSGRGLGAIAAGALLTHCAGGEPMGQEEEPALATVTAPLPAGFPRECRPQTDTRRFDREASTTGYASQTEATRGFGQEPTLLVDSSPKRLESYLTFGFNLDERWHPREVKLRLFATDGTSNGPLLYRASPTLTDFDWNTRPTLLGGPLFNFGAIAAGSWVEQDVTSVMTTPNQLYGFALLPESSDGVDFASIYAPDYQQWPHLRIRLESDPYCTYRGTGGGNTGWTKHYGGAGPEVLQAVATDARGGFVAAGRFGTAPFPLDRGFALARYDANGAPQWTRQVTTQDVTVYALSVTPEGNLLAAGVYFGAPDLGTGPLPEVPRFASLFIAKFSPTGQTVWAQGFLAQSTHPDDNLLNLPIWPSAVSTDAQGSLVVAGNFYGRMDLGGGPLFAGDASVGRNESYWGGFVAKFNWRGEHVWSRALEAAAAEPPATVRTVATDAAGNVLLGGRASQLANLGDGPLKAPTPFIAKYAPTGALVWKRLFSTTRVGEVKGLQATSTGGVAFIADLGGAFSFAGSPYDGGEVDDDPYYQNASSFVGTLSATGTDGWLRDVRPATTERLVTGGDGSVTVSGYGEVYDLGGGTLGINDGEGLTAFVAQYSASGAHRWSRLFDRGLQGEEYDPVPRPHLAAQPGGSVLLGAYFAQPVRVDGTTYTPRGASDLLYLRLTP